MKNSAEEILETLWIAKHEKNEESLPRDEMRERPDLKDLDEAVTEGSVKVMENGKYALTEKGDGNTGDREQVQSSTDHDKNLDEEMDTDANQQQTLENLLGWQ